MNRATLFTDERGVNTVVGYILALAITTILISTLIVGSTTYLRVQQGTVIKAQMDVAGNQLASDIEATDRLLRSSDAVGNSIEVTSLLSDEFAGVDYDITVAPSGLGIYDITLETDNPRVEWTVTVRSETPIQSGSINGGDAVITYDGSQLVISNA
jgi:FlaG/FlaF family flagellin (archaellin)